MLGIAQLKEILSIWEREFTNSSERFWQTKFAKYSWIISQIFACPVTIFQKEAYVGGKSLDNTKGKVVDFLYSNELTQNVALIEIKTPTTALLSSEYRTGIYSPSQELGGSVNQVLVYKDQLHKEYMSLVQSSEYFNAFNPKCMVIAGCLEGLCSDQLRSFELYRRELNNIEIITYDELFSKTAMMLKILEGDK